MRYQDALFKAGKTGLFYHAEHRQMIAVVISYSHFGPCVRYPLNKRIKQTSLSEFMKQAVGLAIIEAAPDAIRPARLNSRNLLLFFDEIWLWAGIERRGTLLLIPLYHQGNESLKLKARDFEIGGKYQGLTFAGRCPLHNGRILLYGDYLKALIHYRTYKAVEHPW